MVCFPRLLRGHCFALAFAWDHSLRKHRVVNLETMQQRILKEIHTYAMLLNVDEDCSITGCGSVLQREHFLD